MNITTKNQKNLYPYLGTTKPTCSVLPFRVVHQISNIFTSNRAPVLNTVPNLTKNGSNLGSEKSFEHLREYKNLLNSEFSKLNNKNHLILSLKKATLSTAGTDLKKDWTSKSKIFAVPNINVLGPAFPYKNSTSGQASNPQERSILESAAPKSLKTGENGAQLISLIGPVKAPKHLSHTNILEPIGKVKNKFSIFGNQVGAQKKGVYLGGKNPNNFNMDTTISNHLKTFSAGPDLPLKFNSDIATSQYLVYSFGGGSNSSASCSKKYLIPANIASILKNSFYSMFSIISKPVLDITPNKIIINLFFFLGGNRGRSRNKNKRQIGNTYKNLKFLSTNHNQLQFLCTNLSKNLKKPVELELIRLYYPYNDSQILANTIGLLSKNIRNRFRSLVDKTFNFSKIKNPSILLGTDGGLLNQKFGSLRKSKLGGAPAPTNQKNKRISILPSFLTGIKIRLGGRLLSQKVVPRFTVQTFQKGSLARSKANIITSSRFTHKNKRGTFSITVSVGQGFF